LASYHIAVTHSHRSYWFSVKIHPQKRKAPFYDDLIGLFCAVGGWWYSFDARTSYSWHV